MYVGVSLGPAAAGLAALFARIPKDQRDGWEADNSAQDYLLILEH
jgi:hypothetical protein